MALGRSLFHRKLFQSIRRLPIWGGKYSYIVVETDVADEYKCICALQHVLAEDDNRAILQPYLKQEIPESLHETLDELKLRFGISSTGTDGTDKWAEKVKGSEKRFKGSEKTFEEELGFVQQTKEWVALLQSVPPEVKNVVAAWNRADRDHILGKIQTLDGLSKTSHHYLSCNIKAIHKQEHRWQHGVRMSFLEGFFFWLWALVMQLGVFAPDTISVFLEAVLAVFRSAPIRLQSQLMAIAIVDYPYRDERLAHFITFQRFIGLLPSALFGFSAILDHSFRRSAFQGVNNLAWKAAICLAWQMAVLNWKNVYDLYFHLHIKWTNHLTPSQVDEIRALSRNLKRCNAYHYAWLNTYRHSNRLGAQLSYYKQDHEDILRGLRWTARLDDFSLPSDDFSSKFLIWIAIIAIGALICASTFPVDPYAGLIALAYYAPLIIRAAVDTWDSSQSFDDALRFFTTTAGPTFPSTVLMLVNVAYWGATKKALFTGFCNAKFGITFGVLFVLSLFPKLWGEAFKNAGLWLQKHFSSSEKTPQRDDDGQKRKCGANSMA